MVGLVLVGLFLLGVRDGVLVNASLDRHGVLMTRKRLDLGVLLGVFGPALDLARFLLTYVWAAV